MDKRKGRGDSVSLMKGIGIGVITAAIVSLLLSVVITILLINEYIDVYPLRYYTLGITVIGSLSGCMTSGKLTKDGVAIAAGLTGATYLFLLIAIGILAFDTGFDKVWTGLIAVIVGCVISCAFCIRQKGVGKRRKGIVC